MQNFEGNIADFDPRNPYAGDERLPIKFTLEPMPDNAATEREGRPMFTDEEFITIYNSKDNIICRPVRESDKQRWPRQYQAWKAGANSTPGAAGTLLEHWPLLTRSQVEEYKYFKVFTVEQLAELPDSVSQSIPGIQRQKALAKAYVETAKGEVPLLKMQLELEARDGVINELRAEMKRLTDLVNESRKQAA